MIYNCPIAKKEITDGVCLEICESLFGGGLSADSIPEADFNADNKTRQTCEHCQYFDLF